MKNILSIATLAAIVGASGAAQAGVNLVQDPSFETTTTGFYYGVGNNKYWYNLGTYDGGTLRGVARTQATCSRRRKIPRRTGRRSRPVTSCIWTAGRRRL